MTTLQVAGFSAFSLIGVSLGLIGGGGSILTLPVLVYLLGISPVISTAYSLFVVDTTALMGSINYMRQQPVNYKAAAVFAVPSFLAIFLTRKYLVPAISDPIFRTNTFVLSKSVVIMVFFALIMLAASYSLIRDRKAATDTPNGPLQFNFPLIAMEGLLVGILAAEYNSDHVNGAENIVIGTLPQHLDQISREKPVVIYCQGDDRATIGYSLLVRNGFTNVKNYLASMNEWVNKGNSVVTEKFELAI